MVGLVKWMRLVKSLHISGLIFLVFLIAEDISPAHGVVASV